MENIPIENVMIPKPPSWISISIMHCPAKVKSFAVSRTISPVTHTAEVDVKSASINDIPFTVDQGSISSPVPEMIRIIKLKIN